MKNIEWLAGLLEGEGCFTEIPSGSSGIYTTPTIALVMTDADVIDEANKLFFSIGGRQKKVTRRVLLSGKVAYSLYLTGLPAVKVMQAVLPFMGARRSLRINEVLRAWNPKKYKDAVKFKESLTEHYNVVE